MEETQPANTWGATSCLWDWETTHSYYLATSCVGLVRAALEKEQPSKKR